MTALRDLHRDDKPREKLIARGVQALKDDELMALLLGCGIRGKDVRKLAREITTLLGDNPEGLTLDTLLAVHGLGVAKAAQILATLELGRRHHTRDPLRLRDAAEVSVHLCTQTHQPQSQTKR